MTPFRSLQSLIRNKVLLDFTSNGIYILLLQNVIIMSILSDNTNATRSLEGKGF